MTASPFMSGLLLILALFARATPAIVIGAAVAASFVVEGAAAEDDDDGGDDDGGDDDGGDDDGDDSDDDQDDDETDDDEGESAAQGGVTPGAGEERGGRVRDENIVGGALRVIDGPGGEPVVADEIIAVGLSSAGRAALLERGFRALSEEDLALIGDRVARLATPRGLDVAAALTEAERIAPEGAYAPNHVYRPSQSSGASSPTNAAADGVDFYPNGVVGLGAGGCSVSVRVGIVDTAVDARHAAFSRVRMRQRRFGAVGASAASGHGNAVASLLVGTLDGAAPLLVVETLWVADPFSETAEARPVEAATAVGVAQALEWLVVDEDVRVVGLQLRRRGKPAPAARLRRRGAARRDPRRGGWK